MALTDDVRSKAIQFFPAIDYYVKAEQSPGRQWKTLEVFPAEADGRTKAYAKLGDPTVRNVQPHQLSVVLN